MFEYRVKQVTKIVDGDTIDVDIDLGFSVRSIVSLAILGNELMSIDENLKKATGKGVFQKVIEAIKRK